MPKLTLIRGIPGSGKSTLAQLLLQADLNAKWLEADHYFMHKGEYHYIPSLVGEAHEWCFVVCRLSLLHGRNVIVSNTFTKDVFIKRYRELANEVPQLRIQEIICIGDFGSVHNVPEQAMQKFRQQAWWLK